MVLCLRQQQAGQECSQGQGQAGDLGDEGGAQHHQQREGIEDGGIAGLCRTPQGGGYVRVGLGWGGVVRVGWGRWGAEGLEKREYVLLPASPHIPQRNRNLNDPKRRSPATRLYRGRSSVRPAMVIPTMVTTALTAADPMALAMVAMPPAVAVGGSVGGWGCQVATTPAVGCKQTCFLSPCVTTHKPTLPPIHITHPPEAPSGLGASRGMSMSSTTTARSWSSSTEKVARPNLDPVSPRSASTCVWVVKG